MKRTFSQFKATWGKDTRAGGGAHNWGGGYKRAFTAIAIAMFLCPN